MKLTAKIWLFLSMGLGIVLAADLTISYRKLQSETQAETAYDAQTIYGFTMATRRIYQEVFIASGLPVDDKSIGFLPAHSFSRIAKDFANWNRNGIIFNNVSDVPRNPDNQADRFELEAMAWFRANPQAKQRLTDIVSDEGVGYQLFTAPIRIEPFCLKCHGNREAAPLSIRQRYDTAYGYKVEDLRGVISIRIPTAQFEKRLWGMWQGHLFKSLIGYGVILLVLGLILDRLVLNRLLRLREGAERIARGDYAARIDQGASGTDQSHRQDELGSLAAGKT